MARGKVGRPAKAESDKIVEYLKFGLTAQEDADLRAGGGKPGWDLTKVVRAGLHRELYGKVPVLGRIPCGPLKHAIEETDRFFDIGDVLPTTPREGDFLLEADGDSMAPEIQPGDFVYLRPNVHYGNGEVCAVQVFKDKNAEGDCEATLKRVYYTPGESTVTLKADNRKYKPLVLDAELVRVVGVRRALIRRVF